MSTSATFEEPVRGVDPVQADGSLSLTTEAGRAGLYGVVLVGGIAVGETAWLAAIGYVLYRLFS